MSLKIIRIGVVILINLFYINSAYAVCTGIACSCLVVATPVLFGIYDPQSGSAVTSNGSLTVTCTAIAVGFNVSYVISLSAGDAGSFSPRTMTGGSAPLNYNLYTTAGLTTIWGDGTSGTGTVSDSYTALILPAIRIYTIYGNLPALQNVIAGSYSDTITVTVTY